MGILLSKLGSTSTVDHGKTKTQGLYTTNLDYDSTIASQLVLKGRLAPFYKGRKKIIFTKFILNHLNIIIKVLLIPLKIKN
jgi:hypothetical protein